MSGLNLEENRCDQEEEEEEEVSEVVSIEDEDSKGMVIVEDEPAKVDDLEGMAELLNHEDIWPEAEASNFAQGKDKARTYLKENLERAELLEKIILTAIHVRRKTRT